MLPLLLLLLCVCAAAAAGLDPQWSALLPHQGEGVMAGLRRGGRLLLADEMGLGKTAQVRAVSSRVFKCVCWPSS
jgi:SNF2 family DNA or RNA helicase